MRKVSLVLLGLIVLSACKKDAVLSGEPGVVDDGDVDNDIEVVLPENIEWDGGVAVFDMLPEENDKDVLYNERQVYSASYALGVAGLDYKVTADLSEALSKSEMVLFSSYVVANSFSTGQVEMIKDYVIKGGIVVFAGVESSDDISELTGVISSSKLKTRTRIYWDLNAPESVYQDDEMEQEISIGNMKNKNAITSYGYTLNSSAIAIAKYETQEAAVVKRKLGHGVVYTLGVKWRDVIQRNQLNKDTEASRVYSNGVEFSGDAWPLFLRSVWVENMEVSAWKYTIPNGYETVVMPTHDIDSRTGYDVPS